MKLEELLQEMLLPNDWLDTSKLLPALMDISERLQRLESVMKSLVAVQRNEANVSYFAPTSTYEALLESLQGTEVSQ